MFVLVNGRNQEIAIIFFGMIPDYGFLIRDNKDNKFKERLQ